MRAACPAWRRWPPRPCRSLGCLDAQCVLCEHNPHRRCSVNFSPKWVWGAHDLACGRLPECRTCRHAGPNTPVALARCAWPPLQCALGPRPPQSNCITPCPLIPTPTPHPPGRYLVNDVLKAKCDAPIRVELIDRTTGQPISDDLPDVTLEVRRRRGRRHFARWGPVQGVLAAPGDGVPAPRLSHGPTLA